MKLKIISCVVILNSVMLFLSGINYIGFCSIYFDYMGKLANSNNSANFFFYGIGLGFLYLVCLIINQQYQFLIGKIKLFQKSLDFSLIFTFISILISIFILNKSKESVPFEDLKPFINKFETCAFYSKIIIGSHLLYVAFHLITINFLYKKEIKNQL